MFIFTHEQLIVYQKAKWPYKNDLIFLFTDLDTKTGTKTGTKKGTKTGTKKGTKTGTKKGTKTGTKKGTKTGTDLGRKIKKIIYVLNRNSRRVPNIFFLFKGIPRTFWRYKVTFLSFLCYSRVFFTKKENMLWRRPEKLSKNLSRIFGRVSLSTFSQEHFHRT